MDRASLIISVVLIVFLTGVLIKEILIAIEIRNTFKCKSCGSRVEKIVNLKTMCTHCSRGEGKIDEHTWRHFFTHRVNSIKAEPKDWVHCYRSYIKYCKIEIGITSFSLAVFVLYIVEQLLQV